MSVREAVDSTSMAFATGGEDFAYYLNESRAMQGLTVIPTETPDWLTTITASLLSPRRMQIAVGMKKPPGTSFAGGGANGLELRRSLWLKAGSVRQRRRAKTGPTAAPLYHHNGCSAPTPLHAGCHKHGEAARDLFCGRRRQWA
jgi:hypothetical protein